MLVPNFTALITAALGDFFTLDPCRVDWKRTAILVLVVLLAFSVLWHRFMPEVREINSTTFKKVPQIQKVKDVQHVYIPCPERGIAVLDKKQLAGRLALPWIDGASTNNNAEAPTRTPGALTAGEVLPLEKEGTPHNSQTSQASHDSHEVLATAAIPESRNGTDVLVILDTTTGVATPVAREKAAPWFQFRNDGALGVRYGIDERLQPIGSVYGKWDFLRIRDLYFSANGTIETDGDAALQLGAEYRW